MRLLRILRIVMRLRGKVMTKRDKCKQELLKFWDANKGEIINLSIKIECKI